MTEIKGKPGISGSWKTAGEPFTTEPVEEVAMRWFIDTLASAPLDEDQFRIQRNSQDGCCRTKKEFQSCKRAT